MAKEIITIVDKNGFQFIEVNNQHAAANISMYGAQVLSFEPHGQEAILWMSELSAFENGKAIRGGIPICFPWFGPHATDNAKPQHGFARLSHWQLGSSNRATDGSTNVILTLKQTPATLAVWPFAFDASVEINVGKQLSVSLTITNVGEEAFSYTDALHTYFSVKDISNISIEGLQGATFFDGFEMNMKTQEADSLHFAGEENRRYINVETDCIINDKGNNRKIHVAKSGSKVTVVWNPGEAIAATMKDIEEGGFKKFVCVEPANAYEEIDVIHLKPGQSFSLSTTIGLL